MKSPTCLIMVILGLSMLGVLTTSTRMLAHLRTHNKALSKNKNTARLSAKLKSKAKSQVRLQGSALNTITMSSEDLKALASKDKEGARNLIKYLNSQLMEADPPKDPKESKDAKPAGGDKEAKPKEEAPKDDAPPKEEAPQPDPESEPITGKADPGLVNVIPTKFNLTDDSKPLILSVQDETGESLLNRHDLDFEEYCNIKQGYLAVAMKEEQNEKLGKPVITIKPVFAVLNKITLTLFENENVKNMYRSYDMKFLKPLNTPLAWEGTHCWQILSGKKNVKIGDKTQKSEKEEKEDNDSVLTSLCAADDLEMNRWMNAIKDFHNCEVKEGPNQQPLVVNQMKKQMDEDVIIEKEREAKDQEEIINLDDQLDQVEEIVAQDQEKLKVQKKKHKLKMEEEEDEIEMLEDKEKCLSENLIEEAKRQELAREQAMNPAKLDVKDVLKNVTKERMDRIIQEEDTQMFMRKKLENNIRETMMEQTKEFNQNYNSQDCYSDDLKGDYKQHIKNVCGHLYRPDANLQVKELLACLSQDGFCRHCCNGYLGVNLMDLRDQCVGKCTTIVDEVSGSLDISVPTEMGVTTHGFLYGLEKEEAKKLEQEAHQKKDE